MNKLIIVAAAAVSVMAGSVNADTMAGIAINGAIGGPGGYHTVVIDGVECKLKNSTRGPNEGCNYTLSGSIGAEGEGTIVPHTGNGGCSTSCE